MKKGLECNTMKYIVLGQEVETTETLNVYDSNDKLRCKPRIITETKVTTTPEILSFEATSFEHNAGGETSYWNEDGVDRDEYGNPTFNINEKETVSEINRVFRADIPAVMIYTDKITKETHTHRVKLNDSLLNCHIENTPFASEGWDKESFEKYKDKKFRQWNKQCVEKDTRLNDYCKLHKLDKETVDIPLLRKTVFGNAKNNMHDDMLDNFRYSFYAYKDLANTNNALSEMMKRIHD